MKWITRSSCRLREHAFVLVGDAADLPEGLPLNRERCLEHADNPLVPTDTLLASTLGARL